MVTNGKPRETVDLMGSCAHDTEPNGVPTGCQLGFDEIPMRICMGLAKNLENPTGNSCKGLTDNWKIFRQQPSVIIYEATRKCSVQPDYIHTTPYFDRT